MLERSIKHRASTPFRRALLLVWALWAMAVPNLAAAQSEGEAQDEEAPITRMPTLQTFVEAVYPPSALEARVEASVVLEIDIDAQGLVEAVRVIESAEPSGHGFDDAALDAAAQFVFTPAEAGGEPIPVTLTYKYNFVLAPVPEPPAPKPEQKPSVRNFTGVLLERGTRKPLSGITVTVILGEGEQAVGYEADSDEEGRFFFMDLSQGEWLVLIDEDPYLPFETRESIATSDVTEAVYYIERGNYSPFDVMVDGDRVRKEVTRRTLVIDEIKRVPGTFGDPLAVVTNLPGVARSAFGDNTIAARGSGGEDSAEMIEGVPGLTLFHFGGLRSSISADMLQSIDFYPGNFSVRYGQRTGAMLNANLKHLRPEAFGGHIDINLFDTGVYLETPIGEDFAVAIGARRSYVDAVLGVALPDDAPLTFITAPRYYDGQILMSWRPSRSHKLRLFIHHQDDAFSYVDAKPKEVDVRARTNSLEVTDNYTHAAIYDTYTPNDDLINESQAGVSLYDNGSVFFGFNSKSTLNEVFVRDVLTWRASDAVTLTLGGDMRLGLGTVDLELGDLDKEGDISSGAPPITNAVVVKTSKRFTAGSLFAEVALSPIEGLSLSPGLRVDLQQWIEVLTLDPRLSARYELLPSFAIKAGVGVFHQPPQPDEMLDPLGNPDVGPERAIHYTAGFEWSSPERLTLDVTGFYKDMDELIVRSDRTIFRNGQLTPERFNNSGRGRAYGLEVLLRHRAVGPFFGWVSYTLSRSERFDPSRNSYRLFDRDQTHILTAVGSLQMFWGLELGLRWRLVSGNPTTPITGAVYDADLDLYIPLHGELNSERTALFHQLDARLEKRWVFDTWMLTTYLDVQNVTNHTNAEGVVHNFDYSRSTPVQGLPIFPALGVRGDF